MKKLLLILFIFQMLFSFSQDKKTDSLKLVFNSQVEVKNKVKTLFSMLKLKQRKDFKNSLSIHYDFLNFVENNNLIKYKYEAYRYLSYYYLRNGVLDSVKIYNNKQYQIAKKIDTNKVISTLQSIGAYYFKKSKPDSSLYYLAKAEKASLKNLISKTKADSINKIHGLLMVRTAIIKSLFQKNKFDTILDLTYQNLKYADKYNIHKYDLFNYYYLGMISMELERYDDALKYYKKELELAKKNKNKNTEAFALLHIGKVYFISKKDPLLALEYFNKADGIFNKQGYFSGKQAVRKNLFNVYENLKQYKKAILIGEDYVAQYLKKQQLDHYLASFYVKLGRVYLLNNNSEKGKNYIEKGINFAKKNDNEKSISIYNEAYITFKKTKDFEKSLYFYEKVKHLKDSLLVNDVFIEKLTDAEVKYQTKKKIRLKNKQLKQQKSKLTIWITAIALLSLFFIFIAYKFYKKHKLSKKENNKILLEIKSLNIKLEEKLKLPSDNNFNKKEFNYYLLEKYKLQSKHLDVWKSLAKGESLKQFVALHTAYKENTVKLWRKELYKKLNTQKSSNFNEKMAIILFRDELEYFTYKA